MAFTVELACSALELARSAIVSDTLCACVPPSLRLDPAVRFAPQSGIAIPRTRQPPVVKPSIARAPIIYSHLPWSFWLSISSDPVVKCSGMKRTKTDSGIARFILQALVSSRAGRKEAAFKGRCVRRRWQLNHLAQMRLLPAAMSHSARSVFREHAFQTHPSPPT